MRLTPFILTALTVALGLTTLSGTSIAQVARIELQWQNCPANVLCRRVDGYGTAVAVAHYQQGTVFATAAHSFRPQEAGFKRTRLTVQGKPAELKGQWLDSRSIDFALVFVPRVRFPLVPLAPQAPQAGDEFYVSGYDFAVSNKPVIRYYKGRVTKAEQGDFGQASISWPVGTSGGPVVNAAGELIGIAVHSSGFMINWDFARVITGHFPGATFADTPVRYTRESVSESSPNAASPQRNPSGPLADVTEGKELRVEGQSPKIESLPSESVAAPKPIHRVDPQSERKLHQRGSRNMEPGTHQSGTQNRKHNNRTAAEPEATAADAASGRTQSDRRLSGTEASHGRAADAAPESRTSPDAFSSRQAADSVGPVFARDSRAEHPRSSSPRNRTGRQHDEADPRSRTGEVLDAADSLLLNPWVQALIVGASGGTGAAALAGWQVLSTIRRKRKEGRENDRQHSQPQVSLPSSLAPPSSADCPFDNVETALNSTITNRLPQSAPPLEWVNADSSFYARAHDEARRQIGRRYPGAQEVLEAELSLVRQFLAGQQPASSHG